MYHFARSMPSTSARASANPLASAPPFGSGWRGGLALAGDELGLGLGDLSFHLLTGGVELTSAALGAGALGIQATLTRRDLLKPRLHLALARHALGKGANLRTVIGEHGIERGSGGARIVLNRESLDSARPVGFGRHPIQAHRGANGVDDGVVLAAGFDAEDARERRFGPARP